MRIIPALDIIDGKCVRLTQGDYHTTKIYNENPLEVVKYLESKGFQYLHVVDLDGAKANRIMQAALLEKLASQTCMKIDFGGGIKSEEDIKIAFDAGAQQITIGSLAAKAPEQVLDWLKKYGSERIILGADCKNRKIATQGWTENSSIDIFTFLQKYAGIARYTIVTDIEKDGMLLGPSFGLYEEIITQRSFALIASGGVSSLSDVIRLKEMGCDGVIIGKAIYEKTIDLNDLAKKKKKRGLF